MLSVILQLIVHEEPIYYRPFILIRCWEKYLRKYYTTILVNFDQFKTLKIYIDFIIKTMLIKHNSCNFF